MKKELVLVIMVLVILGGLMMVSFSIDDLFPLPNPESFLQQQAPVPSPNTLAEK